MPTLSTSLNIPFAPTKTAFILQVTGGACKLERRGTPGAAWATVCGYNGLAIQLCGAHTVDNPVPGAEYRLVEVSGSPSVQVDE